MSKKLRNWLKLKIYYKIDSMIKKCSIYVQEVSKKCRYWARVPLFGTYLVWVRLILEVHVLHMFMLKLSNIKSLS